MTLEFKTKTDKTGYCHYLLINTRDKKFTTRPRGVLVRGVEVDFKDYRSIIDKCIADGYTEINW